MASRIGSGNQRVTGSEPYWGNVQLSPEDKRLINASPTLQSQLGHYGADVDSHKMQPMSASAGGGTYFSGDRIVVDNDYSTAPSDAKVGGLSHEIGHYENRDNDASFKSRYAVNPRDPNAYNVSALTGLHSEGEAVQNNWQVQQEIARNTATPNAPGTSIDLAAPTGTQQQFDDQHAADMRAGASDVQDRNRLTTIGMSAYANNVPSTDTSKSYYQYYGGAGGARAPEPGRPNSVTFTGDDKGDVNSMQERWPSGNVGTQQFKEGKIQSSNMVDGNGNTVSTADYAHNQDGSYSVDVKNGAGQETERGDFNADKSGTVRDYANDGSTRSTSFDANNRNTQIEDRDATGNRTRGDYFDADSGQYTNQMTRNADGGRTVLNFDTDGRARMQFNYAADGSPVRRDDFDESGRNTFAVQYNKDGSRAVATFNADGTQTSHTVDRNGNRSEDTTTSTSTPGQGQQAGTGGSTGEGGAPGAGVSGSDQQGQATDRSPAASGSTAQAGNNSSGSAGGGGQSNGAASDSQQQAIEPAPAASGSTAQAGNSQSGSAPGGGQSSAAASDSQQQGADPASADSGSTAQAGNSPSGSATGGGESSSAASDSQQQGADPASGDSGSTAQTGNSESESDAGGGQSSAAASDSQQQGADPASADSGSTAQTGNSESESDAGGGQSSAAASDSQQQGADPASGDSGSTAQSGNSAGGSDQSNAAAANDGMQGASDTPDEDAGSASTQKKDTPPRDDDQTAMNASSGKDGQQDTPAADNANG